MGAYAPEDVRVRAITLSIEGKSNREIATIVGVHPVTVWRWLDDVRNDPQWEEAERRQLVREHRIIGKVYQAIEDGVDFILEQGPATAAKSLVPLNMVGGTTLDKQFKRKELALKERDQSQLLGELLAAITERAATLPKQPLTTPSPETLSPTKETKLIAEAQKKGLSGQVSSNSGTGNSLT